MKIIKIPFGNFRAMMFFGVILSTVPKEKLNRSTINHEEIHFAQFKEMLFIGFYIFYITEWLIKLLNIYNKKSAYHRISFEREAYMFQHDYNYIKTRKKYSWIKYLFRD